MAKTQLTTQSTELLEHWFPESQEYQVWSADGAFIQDFGYPERAKAFAVEMPGRTVVSKHWTSHDISDRSMWGKEEWGRLMTSLTSHAWDYFNGAFPVNVKQYFTVQEKSFERPPAKRFDDFAVAEAYCSLDRRRYLQAVVVGQVWGPEK